MRGSSLRFRLAALGALAVILSLTAAGYVLVHLFSIHVERQALAEMEFQLEQVIAAIQEQGDGFYFAAQPLNDPRFARPYGGRYWQVDANNQTLRSRSLWDYELPRTDLQPGSIQTTNLPGPDGEQLLALRRHVQFPSGAKAVVSTAMNATELSQARREFSQDLYPYIILLGAFLIVGQLFQLTYGLRPLRRIGSHIAALRSGDEKRMGDDWPQEMKPLAREIDGLLEAREAAIEKARFRAADLAHGLKTPLQALMGEASRLRQRGEDDPANAIEGVTEAMQAHVERELARARAALSPGHARAEIADVVDRVLGVLKRTPRGKEIDWHLDVPGRLSAALDPADLAEAVGALAENAMRHAVSAVTIRAGDADEFVELHIIDDGEGPANKDLVDLAQRGMRLDQSSNGTGFGLSIAKDIAEAAGGWLTMSPRDPGVCFTLSLPTKLI